MYSSVFTLMYHAALRASEICVTPLASHTLKANQLIITKTTNGNAIKIKFSSYKHSTSEPTPLVIYPSETNGCPVKAYKEFCHVRCKHTDLAYVNKDNTPLSRQQLARTLHGLLEKTKMKPSHYNTHSFRIGKATDMANNGYTHAQIAMLGRWKSNAFLKYIKPTIIHGTS